MKSCARRFLPLSVLLRHSGNCLIRAAERISQQFFAFAHIADLDRIINVGDDGDSRRWEQLDYPVHRLNILLWRQHLERSGAIGKQRREAEAVNIFGKNMKIRLEMSVRTRRSQCESH